MKPTIMPAVTEIVHDFNKLAEENERLVAENLRLAEACEMQYRRGYSAGYVQGRRGGPRHVEPADTGRPRLHLVEQPATVVAFPGGLSA